jgi:hypothetical protein
MGDNWSSTQVRTFEYVYVVNMQYVYESEMKTWGLGYAWPVRNP